MLKKSKVQGRNHRQTYHKRRNTKRNDRKNTRRNDRKNPRRNTRLNSRSKIRSIDPEQIKNMYNKLQRSRSYKSNNNTGKPNKERKPNKEKETRTRNNSFEYYVRDKPKYVPSVNKSKGKTIKKHLKKLSDRIKLSYKLVSSDRNDYAQTTRVKLENANKPIKEVYEYLKNKHRREKRKGIKKSYNSSNSNNSSSN